MGTAAFFAPGPERRNNLYPRGERRACVGVHPRKSEKTSGESRHAAALSSIIPSRYSVYPNPKSLSSFDYL